MLTLILNNPSNSTNCNVHCNAPGLLKMPLPKKRHFFGLSRMLAKRNFLEGQCSSKKMAKKFIRAECSFPSQNEGAENAIKNAFLGIGRGYFKETPFEMQQNTHN
ncbi:MAG TPA: hypothetical protein VLC98_11360 [Phnomibacter sp.]|nr:hypothetical protein [Phnomibacter sp.]